MLMGSGVSLSDCLSVPFVRISKVIIGNRGSIRGSFFFDFFWSFSFGEGVRGKVPELL